MLQLFEYILEYLRTVRFGEPDHSLALPADQTELAQIVREVTKHLTSLLQQPQYTPCLHLCLPLQRISGNPVCAAHICTATSTCCCWLHLSACGSCSSTAAPSCVPVQNNRFAECQLSKGVQHKRIVLQANKIIIIAIIILVVIMITIIQ